MTMPEWMGATMRYAVTMLGVLLAALDLIPESSWDQVGSALLALLTALYGVWRTREQEKNLEATESALALFAGSAWK